MCDNLGEHMIGNVYVKFRREEDAAKAVEDLNKRWFNHSPVYAELSPVSDFREACCRQYEMGECRCVDRFFPSFLLLLLVAAKAGSATSCI